LPARSRTIVWFQDCDASFVPEVGGKCASLGELMRAGMRVPPGFAVTTAAHTRFLHEHDLRRHEQELLEGVDYERMSEVAEASRKLREYVEQCAVPAQVEQEIRTAYASMEARPVAVRSSAIAEDMSTASFAGQLQTYLWIEGEDAVVEHVRRCWSGFFTPEALSYRKNLGIGEDEALMSVGVQRMVHARSAGVMFTLNPINGDPSKIAIEATWGLGEALVSGEVNPDRFMVDKVTLDVLDRTIGEKAIEYRPEGGKVSAHPIEDERRTTASISEAEVVELARVGKEIERHYGRPEDVEWVIDAGRGELFVLQARAETVWSRRERPSLVEKKGSALDYVVADLLKRTKT
jgi:phenol phosphorylase subunit beta